MRLVLALLCLLPALRAAEIPRGERYLLDAQGSIWVFGSVASQAFTATPGAIQPKYSAGEAIGFGTTPGSSGGRVPTTDLFLMRLNRDGTEMEEATYFGGPYFETLYSVALGADGSVYLVATLTPGVSFPGVPPAADSGLYVVARINRDLTKVEYLRRSSTKLSALDVAPDGSAYLVDTPCEWDSVRLQSACTATVLGLNASGSAVLWLQPIVAEDGTAALSVAPDGQSLWVSGSRFAMRLRTSTGSVVSTVNLPIQAPVVAIAGSQNGGAVVGQNAVGAAFLTSLTGSIAAEPVPAGRFIQQFLRDENDIVHVRGLGRFGVPVSEQAIERCATPANERFLLGWDIIAKGTRYGSFVPGLGTLVTASNNQLLVAGAAGFERLRPASFPVREACVTWPLLNIAAAIPEGDVTRAAFLSPGEFVSIHGAGFGPASQANIEMDGRRQSAPRQIGATRVLFNGVPAALLSAGPGKITAQVPYALQGLSKVSIQVEQDGLSTEPIEMGLRPTTPDVLPDGRNPYPVYNQDWSVNSEQNPSGPGDVVTVFVSGGGRLRNVEDDAAALPDPAPLAESEISASLPFGGVQAVPFAGGVPGQLPGLLQVNVRLAADLNYHGKLPLVLSFDGNAIAIPFWIR